MLRESVQQVAAFRRTHESHMLINAHPAFADAASAAGCINEPPEGQKPTMEMRAAQLRVLPRREQSDPFAYAQWLVFAAEHPEVDDRLIYFVSLRERYADGAELTACCAPRPTIRAAHRHAHSALSFKMHASKACGVQQAAHVFAASSATLAAAEAM